MTERMTDERLAELKKTPHLFKAEVAELIAEVERLKKESKTLSEIAQAQYQMEESRWERVLGETDPEWDIDDCCNEAARRMKELEATCESLRHRVGSLSQRHNSGD